MLQLLLGILIILGILFTLGLMYMTYMSHEMFITHDEFKDNMQDLENEYKVNLAQIRLIIAQDIRNELKQCLVPKPFVEGLFAQLIENYEGEEKTPKSFTTWLAYQQEIFTKPYHRDNKKGDPSNG